jgi:hypothetical protein
MTTQANTLTLSRPSPLEAQAVPTATLHEYRPRPGRPGSREGRHLEEVRDILRAQRDLEAPDDPERSPSTIRLRLGYDTPHRMQITYPEGMGEPMTLSRHALRQLAARTLPARGLGFIDKLSQVTIREGEEAKPRGAQMATMTWALLNRQHTDPVMFRTVMRGGQRQVRAVLSQGYATYDNLEFIEDTLTSLGSTADLYRTIGWRITDEVMRLRLVGGSEEGLRTWQRRDVDKPMPMVELWNSEVGRRAVYVKSGTYTLWCSNGCGHWSDDGVWRWNHTGRTAERIRSGVRSAIEEAGVKAQGIVEAYDAALSTAIDDAYAWFESQVEGDLTETQREQVQQTLLHNPTVHGNGRLLASVVDAVTYVAHEQASLFEEERLERIGARLLHRGLQQAEAGRVITALL